MENFWLKLRDVPTTTLGRVIALILSIANELVAVIGSYTFASGSSWYPILSTLVVGLVAIWNSWQNNSFTWFASAADKFLDAMDDKHLTKEEIDNIILIIDNANKRNQ